MEAASMFNTIMAALHTRLEQGKQRIVSESMDSSKNSQIPATIFDQIYLGMARDLSAILSPVSAAAALDGASSATTTTPEPERISGNSESILTRIRSIVDQARVDHDDADDDAASKSMEHSTRSNIAITRASSDNDDQEDDDDDDDDDATDIELEATYSPTTGKLVEVGEPRGKPGRKKEKAEAEAEFNPDGSVDTRNPHDYVAQELGQTKQMTRLRASRRVWPEVVVVANPDDATKRKRIGKRKRIVLGAKKRRRRNGNHEKNMEQVEKEKEKEEDGEEEEENQPEESRPIESELILVEPDLQQQPQQVIQLDQQQQLPLQINYQFDQEQQQFYAIELQQQQPPQQLYNASIQIIS